ncbi:MAG: hypothetical protein U1F50_03750 [Rubrivivax sp.]
MKALPKHCLPAALAALAGCATPPPSKEEILVLRSVRESRTDKSDWCTRERTGFAAAAEGGFTIEDRFSLWAVQSRGGDGRVVDAAAGRAGELRTCLASTADRRVLAFHGEGTVTGEEVSGHGDCRVLQADQPAKGLFVLACQLVLKPASAVYTGGQLTSNTLNSPATFGMASDPPGYTQVSIATVRLWRREPR